MPLSDGDTFAGYTVQRLIGSGLSGEIYLALNGGQRRLDALRLLPAWADDTVYELRFARVAHDAAKLSHARIVDVHEHGDDAGRLWLATDYVDGSDASALLNGDYPAGMPINLVLDIASAVAEGLDFTHDHGLVHLCVKPANILLGAHHSSHRRRILLSDLGIPRRAGDISGIAGSGKSVGALRYFAPEQLSDGPVGGRADQYALAATVYSLLTNAPLFTGDQAAVVDKHLNTAPPRLSDTHPSLSHLDDIMARALAKDPGERYERCLDFSDALTAAHTSHQTQFDDTIAVPPKTKGRWTTRKSTIAVLASIGIIATLSTVVAGVVAAFLGRNQPVAANPAPSSELAAPTSTVPEIPIAPLAIRPVVEAFVPNPDQCVEPPPPVPPTETLITCDLDKTGIFTLEPTVLELQLTSVEGVMMPNMTSGVQIVMDEASQAAFAEYTRAHIGQRIAFVRDQMVVYFPTITTPLDSQALQLAGELTREQADRMVSMLQEGS